MREGNSRRGGSGERASGRSAEETSSEKHLYSLLNYLADREAIRNVLLLHGLYARRPSALHLQDPGRADKTSPVAVLPTPPPANPVIAVPAPA